MVSALARSLRILGTGIVDRHLHACSLALKGVDWRTHTKSPNAYFNQKVLIGLPVRRAQTRTTMNIKSYVSQFPFETLISTRSILITRSPVQLFPRPISIVRGFAASKSRLLRSVDRSFPLHHRFVVATQTFSENGLGSKDYSLVDWR
jgi:hypothetical protein